LVSHAIIQALTPFEARVKSLTYDNGKEFCGHALISEALKSTDYFASLFASLERGGKENMNSLLRQYVPKKRPRKTLTTRKIK
jgi:IS30 family transposase